MRAPLDEQDLAELLPGSWTVAATNLPMLLSGRRRDPRFDFDIVSRTPLVMTEDATYRIGPGKNEGEYRHILGKNSFTGDEFVWRAAGLRRFAAIRWTVAGASHDRTIAVLNFSQSMLTPAGVNIIVRERTRHPELRAIIAHATEDYGLTPEQFASLTWCAETSSDVAGRGGE
ncbi:MAG: hypothetical protein ACRCSP_05895 [Rhodoglobus sp.]